MELQIERVRIGEMAHIIAQQPRGPRGDAGYEGDIDEYDNLILLCNNHHEAVDGDAEAYPIARLREMKRSHEAWVRSRLSVVSQRYIDVNGLQILMRFLPITQIGSALAILPDTLDNSFFHVASALETFPIDNPQCRPFVDPILERDFLEFEDGFAQLMSAVSGPNFGQNYYEYPANGGPLRINRTLSPKKIEEVRRSVGHAVERLYPAYYRLLSYLRQAYPEVNLLSFGK